MVTVSLQEKSGIYQAVLNYKDDNGKRKQKWVSTKLKVRGNKKQALAKAEEIRANFEKKLEFKNLNNFDDTVVNNVLFLDFLVNWLEMVKNTIEPSTYTSYNQIVSDRITKYFSANKIMLKDLTPVHIQAYYNTMYSEGLSANTVIHHHAIIRKCLDYAFKMDIIPNNPADKVQRPKKEQFIGEFYTTDQLINLIEDSKGDELELIILLTVHYGLRRSEVLGLKWDAIDFKNKTLTIKHTVVIAKIDGKRQLVAKDRTKNKSSYRTLPLIDTIAIKLQEHKTKQETFKKKFGSSYNKDYLDYICVNPQGMLIRPDYISQHFKLLLEKNNLKHIRFHDLRHSCASLLLSSGVQMKSIQEWMGHSNFSTTANIYAHLDCNSKQSSADEIASALNINNLQKNRNEECESSSLSNNI